MIQRESRLIFSIIISAIVFLSIYGCSSATIIGKKVHHEKLIDGKYEGSFSNWPNKAAVNVTIKNSKIEDIEVTTHFCSWVGNKATGIIPQRIISEQETNVDAVTGATNSSHVIMNAVQKAVEKAYKK